MLKQWIIIPVAAVATIVLTMLIYTFLMPKPQYEPVYTIRAIDGQVVLCEKGSDEVLLRYDIYTVLLPSADAKTLEDGIDVKNYAAAQSILEDYGL